MNGLSVWEVAGITAVVALFLGSFLFIVLFFAGVFPLDDRDDETPPEVGPSMRAYLACLAANGLEPPDWYLAEMIFSTDRLMAGNGPG